MIDIIYIIIILCYSLSILQDSWWVETTEVQGLGKQEGGVEFHEGRGRRCWEDRFVPAQALDLVPSPSLGEESC